METIILNESKMMNSQAVLNVQDIIIQTKNMFSRNCGVL